MKINFILPAAGKTGGVVVVLEHARRLSDYGHDVRVYYPLVDYGLYLSGIPRWRLPFARIRLLFRNLRQAFGGVGWIPEAIDLRAVPFIRNAFIRDADVVVATASATAYSVARLTPAKGRKFYFIQGHEVWNGKVERVEATYRLPLKLLTIAPWLTQLVQEKSGRAVTAEIRNGVDLDTFRPPSSRPAELSIVMMHHTQGVKGIPDGLDVLRRLHARHPGVRVRMFGLYPFPQKDDFIEYTRNPSREELAALYQTSHIYLSPSLSEGWQLPPMEAMACGCAVVATRVGCIPVLEQDGNLLSAEPGDRDSLLRQVESLVENPRLLRETAEKGLRTIAAFGWEGKSREFERVLLSDR